MGISRFREIPSTENVADQLIRDILNSLRENQQKLIGVRGSIHDRALLVIDAETLGIVGVLGAGDTATLFKKDQAPVAPFQPEISTRLVAMPNGDVSVNTKRIDDTDSPYDVQTSDGYIFCDTDNGDVTVNLLAGVNGLSVKVVNTGSGVATVNPNGAELLMGENSGWSLYKGEKLDVVYNSIEGWF